MNAQLQTIEPKLPQRAGAVEAFELFQRKAKALAASDIIPEGYRGNLANVLVALEIAERIGASPLQVMQNLYLIQGRPSWSSSFLIATVNSCGRFTPLRFDVQGDDPAADGYRVRAFADDKGSKERCNGPWITWPMVKAEGWFKKSGSKWQTMPELMFMYRAAGFWSRVYAPEVSMGILTREEAEDISTVVPHTPAASTEVIDAPALATYTHDDFQAHFEKWRPLLESGKRSADDIITLAETKAVLTDEMKAAIRDVSAVRPEGESA